MYETLIDALRRGAAAEALSAAREAVAANPNDATAHRLLGAALHLGGDRTAALQAVDAALELMPDDAGLHVERAALLVGVHDLDQAQGALAKAVGLDPNQFPAYIIQGQLALARGDLDEADRVGRLAARIAPSHPHVAGIQGMVALRHGQVDHALAVLSRASQQAPENQTLRNALGFAYMAKGHFAFAEQCFRKLLEEQPDSVPLRALTADLVRRQGRAVEAADEAAPLLRSERITPGLRRVIGELELAAGRHERALEPLKAAFAAMPGDLRTLRPLVEVWRRLGAADEARTTLDAALAAHPQDDNLWRARLVFEPFAGPEALAVVERWMEARPDYIPALQARAAIHDAAGEIEEADAIAYQIVAIEPGHAQAELRVVDHLLRTDPPAAVARVRDQLAQAQDDAARELLRQVLGRCQDAAGDIAAAAATWTALRADLVGQRLPLPPLTAGALGELPPLAPTPERPGVLWLWGPPGSMVDRIAANFEYVGAPVCTDRFGLQPPPDALQRYGTAQELLDGSLDGAFLVNQWRATLPSRGITGGPVFDWLLWWDHALLHAMRPHLPEAVLMFAIRDPRDMLLDWLAHDSPNRFAIESPEIAAQWLAAALTQIAEVVEGNLFPHRLLKLDELAYDPAGLAAAIGEALGIQLPSVPAFNRPQLAAGHWRAYTGPLAAAFAALKPVAVRLGYAET